jgi:hypothetical protein
MIWLISDGNVSNYNNLRSMDTVEFFRLYTVLIEKPPVKETQNGKNNTRA